MNLFEAVIGLEVHAQLQTDSKIFSSDPSRFGEEPNSVVGVVSAGVPGALPSLNKKAVELAVKLGIALNCKINLRNRFDRKHYFYPDLPKGYQITQFAEPICGEGFLEISEAEKKVKKRIGIDHIHMEEDAGKSIHRGALTLVNLNRAGVPLVEIVSKPEMRTPFEAVAYLKSLHEILVFLEVSDANMEEGNFRCDANVSIRRLGETELGTRTEIKNINSFRFVEKALDFEIARQIAVVDAGGRVSRETRGWDAAAAKTFSMRSKELAEDYRYFPDPDLPELVLDSKWVEKIRENSAENPEAIRKRLAQKLGLSESECTTLMSRKDSFEFFESAVALGTDPVLASRWINEELLRRVKELGPEATLFDLNLKPQNFSDFIGLIKSGKITGKIAKTLIKEILASQKNANDLVRELGFERIIDPKIHNQWVDEVVEKNPGPVAEFSAGKEKVLAFLVGAAMGLSRGKGDPAMIETILRDKLLARKNPL